MINLEPGDIVFCTVDRIVGTTVFVHIEGHGEGSIVFSEIAPGRIRNIRDYVVPKKRIVCKILRVSHEDRIDLSFRRVTLKEQKELKEMDKQERSFRSVLKTILKERAEKVIEEITKKDKIFSFIQKIKENPKELEKIIGSRDSKKILEIVMAEKQKKQTIKREIILKSTGSDGLEVIKAILGHVEGAEIRYISAGKYSLAKEGEDIKQADQKLREIIEAIEKKAKKDNLEFSIVKK